MIARTIHIHGKVQGVFFRDWTVDAARAIGINGWVRNRRDGSVEVLAVGDPALVDRFIDRLREGSSASQVDGMDVSDVPLQAIDGFTRRATE
jgi:acylphosphatase